MSEQAEIASIPIPSSAVPLFLAWESVPQVEVYVLCRLQVPVRPEHGAALMAGAFDLMMERWVLPPWAHGVVERAPGPAPHRLLVARLAGGRFLPVSSLAVVGEAGPNAVSLRDFGPPILTWSAGLRVGGGPPQPEAAPPVSYGVPFSRATVTERGSTGARPSAFVERPLSVREGRVLGQVGRGRGGRPLHSSPLEAYEKELRPRQVPGGRLPDLRSPSAVAPPSGVANPSDAPAAPPDLCEPPGEAPTPLWAVIASPTLLRDGPAARAALRMLRGFLRVALVGLADRAAIERWAGRAGVPLDGVFALPGDADTLPRALGCRSDEMVVFTLPGEAAPRGVRQIEVEPEGFAEAAEQLCDDL